MSLGPGRKKGKAPCRFCPSIPESHREHTAQVRVLMGFRGWPAIPLPTPLPGAAIAPGEGLGNCKIPFATISRRLMRCSSSSLCSLEAHTSVSCQHQLGIGSSQAPGTQRTWGCATGPAGDEAFSRPAFLRYLCVCYYWPAHVLPKEPLVVYREK